MTADRVCRTMSTQGWSSRQLVGLNPRSRGCESHPLRQITPAAARIAVAFRTRKIARRFIGVSSSRSQIALEPILEMRIHVYCVAAHSRIRQRSSVLHCVCTACRRTGSATIAFARRGLFRLEIASESHHNPNRDRGVLGLTEEACMNPLAYASGWCVTNCSTYSFAAPWQ